LRGDGVGLGEGTQDGKEEEREFHCESSDAVLMRTDDTVEEKDILILNSYFIVPTLLVRMYASRMLSTIILVSNLCKKDTNE